MFAHMVEICIKDKCIELNKDLFEKALEIRKEMINRGDLRTRWWIRFMIALFTPVSVGSMNTFSFTDTTGVSRTQNVKATLGTNSVFLNTSYCNNRFWISVGSDSTPPNVDNVSIRSKITEALASFSSDESNGVIVLSAGFQFASDTTIYEVGLEWEATLTGSSTCGRVLIDRSVISGGFTAPANTPITVTYRILV